MAKEVPVYYLKPIVKLGDVKPGSYVFNDEAHLCYVDDEHTLHFYKIEEIISKNELVFLVTLETSRISTWMREIFKKFSDADLINFESRNKLRDFYFRLMTNPVGTEDYSEKEDAIWKEIDAYYESMFV